MYGQAQLIKLEIIFQPNLVEFKEDSITSLIPREDVYDSDGNLVKNVFGKIVERNHMVLVTIDKKTLSIKDIQALWSREDFNWHTTFYIITEGAIKCVGIRQEFWSKEKMEDFVTDVYVFWEKIWK